MLQFQCIKPIYTAIAAPGAGKTEGLLSRVPGLISEGQRIVIALPTLVLIDEIAHRASSRGISFRLIDHRSGESVVKSLELALSDNESTLIICTQESIRRVRPQLLRRWTLVIDELPTVVNYPDYPLNATELERLLQYTEECDGQLQIKEGMEQVVTEQVMTHWDDARGADCSTLAHSGAHIFRLLLSNVDVFIDKTTIHGKRHVRAVEEITDWWDILSSAAECHVLAASVRNSEFEVLAKVHGFRFEDSGFTSGWTPESSRVTIYPVMPKGQKFSRGTMTMSVSDKRLIDITLATILEHADSTPLLFANKWARFASTPGVAYVPKDCRGLNSYTSATEAAVLFGGNPSPSDSKGLEYLEAKYKVVFKQAFVTTRLLEPTLQAVARTAIRCRDNTSDIKFYVQDYRAVDYLLSTYFPNAKVDWSIAAKIPIKRDGRKLDKDAENEVVRLLSLNTSAAQINKQTGVSRRKIQKMKEALLAA